MSTAGLIWRILSLSQAGCGQRDTDLTEIPCLPLGFYPDTLSRSATGARSPGMDAIRTLAALVGVVALPATQQPLEIPRWSLEEKRERQQLQKRPDRSEYSYAVRVSTYGGSPLPLAITSPPELYEFVAALFARPAAVAVCPPKSSKHQKTHAWACFDPDELGLVDRFVPQLDGYKVGRKRLMLRVHGP